ncbi:Leucine-rich repeat protein [Handroanthus impetiginosus]|uniref:Leucine-rich repeat protein n=1 Tax=Handroanthus impetiginosus TaxID=429701 RepID=A0A2G9HGG8_9LAMI|nr:Leucine-rich repeat protein [Handroanthus impetiginosus]
MSNNLSGSIPPKIGKLFNLKSLWLWGNKLSGSIPLEIWKLYSLSELDLSGNNLSGTITPQIGKLYKLSQLDLSTNNLSGSIPPEIGKLFNLESLWLFGNNLDGTIPSSICNLSSLGVLQLSENRLQGRIPQCLGNFSTSLTYLALNRNQLYGPVPTTFADGNKLEHLNLNGNKLQGPLPKSLYKCRWLQFLDIGNNEIQDSFPFWVESLPKLRVLVMRSNKFHGKVFSDYLKNDSIFPFPNLQIFDISHNEFTGPLPDGYFQNLVAMMNVRTNKTAGRNRIAYYSESFTLVFKGFEYKLLEILLTFTTLDFSDNKFNGSIPNSIGKLNSLIFLNFSHNMLEGKIPASFGNLSELEQLDLSSNQLQGEIPWELTRLSFLESLNLSNNLLYGPIPHFGGQFLTFENNSYIGNPRLCGYPLTKKCKDDDDDDKAPQPMLKIEGDDSEFLDGFTWQAVVMGYGCGLVFGVTMGCLALLYRRPMWLLKIFLGV